MNPLLADIPLDPQIIIALLFVVFGGVKWLFEKVTKKDQPHDISSSIEDVYDQYRAQIVDQQTKIKKPTPPPVSDPEAEPGFTLPTPAQSFVAKEPTVPNLTAAEKEALDRLKQESVPSRKSHRARGSQAAKVRQLLQNPDSVQTAIVLQEVLGPPKALR